MSNSAINSNHRELWIDCARGIAILLVIVGHTISGVLSGAIYSFHMPLFFIFSGITSKFSSTNKAFVAKTERSFKHLMGPFFLIYVIQTIIYLLRHLSNIFQDRSFLTDYLYQRILSGIFSSGVSISVLNATVLYVGVIWFFPALFLSKTLFDYLHLKLKTKQLLLYCLLFSILGILIGQIQPLPFSFDIVLAILPLFYIGSHFDNFRIKKSPSKKFLLYSFLWGLFLIITYVLGKCTLELAPRRYPAYPLCFITAVLGTLMVSEFSVICCNYRLLSSPLQYIGENSLYLLCIHTLEWDYLTKLWQIHSNQYICTIIRVILDLILFFFFMFLRSKCLAYKKHGHRVKS